MPPDCLHEAFGGLTKKKKGKGDDFGESIME